MTEEERVERFLEIFKSLEKEVVRASNLRDADFVSFSRALNECFHKKKHPVLSDYDVYSFLRSASDIRNILSHENDTCVPTEIFLSRMEKILDMVLHPLTLIDICTRDIHTCSLSDSVLEMMKVMEKYGVSHLPVTNEQHYVIGVFSRSSIFDYLLEGKTLNRELKIQDLQGVIELDQHHNESFLFASRNSGIDDVYNYMSKRKPHQKHVACVFVTDNGSQKSTLRGILTLSDLAAHYNETEFN